MTKPIVLTEEEREVICWVVKLLRFMHAESTTNSYQSSVPIQVPILENLLARSGGEGEDQ